MSVCITFKLYAGLKQYLPAEARSIAIEQNAARA
jgi:hypothetical protein